MFKLIMNIIRNAKENIGPIEFLVLDRKQTCECNLKLNACPWPGQCESDIKINKKIFFDEMAAHNVKELEKYKEMKMPEMMFGKTKEEIATALDFYHVHGPKKISHVDALEKIGLAIADGHSTISGEDVMLRDKLLRVFKAFGLIKFDKEPEKPKEETKFTMLEAIRHCRSVFVEGDAFIEGLEKFGYKIVRTE